ncbi:MAG: cytochrome c4 [Methylococcales bacterium]|nr:cytochrome c4 [Methylococcales bacterium]
MIKKLLALSISLAFSAVPVVVQAGGDMAEGKVKAANCASCHGEDGNSMMGNFPKLAGQHASYLVKQLNAFKDNTRNAPMMAPLAMGLDDGDMEDLAAFYASQKTSSNQMPVIFSDDDDDDDEEAEGEAESSEDTEAEVKNLISLGGDLYRNGNLKSEVSACIACHGPKGAGNKPASFPAVRGQHADYLIKSLTDFKKGTRNESSDNMMHMIAKKMTDKEIQAVSYHISMMK